MPSDVAQACSRAAAAAAGGGAWRRLRLRRWALRLLAAGAGACALAGALAVIVRARQCATVARVLERAGGFSLTPLPTPASDPALAVALLCFSPSCPAPASTLCAAIRALRSPEAGAFGGRAVVVTDAPYAVRELPCGRHAEVAQPAAGQTAASNYNYIRVQNLKRELFDIIGAPRILYLDLDVIVTAPIAPFVERAEGVLRAAADANITGAAAPAVAMFGDNACPTCNKWNGGVIYAIDTPATRACFDAWSRILRADAFTRFTKEQDALDIVSGARAAPGHDDAPCAGVATLHSAEMVYARSATSAFGLEGTFVHITSSARRMCARLGSSKHTT